MKRAVVLHEERLSDFFSPFFVFWFPYDLSQYLPFYYCSRATAIIHLRIGICKSDWSNNPQVAFSVYTHELYSVPCSQYNASMGRQSVNHRKVDKCLEDILRPTYLSAVKVGQAGSITFPPQGIDSLIKNLSTVGTDSVKGIGRTKGWFMEWIE